jgi:CHAT domain-containing protein
MPKGQAGGKTPGAPDRLAWSAREAAAIVGVAGADKVLVRSGFEATREVLQTREFQTARILHLSTHAIADERQPALSRIEFSRFDRTGARRDGELHYTDILSLSFRNDLVVLSTCESGAGRDAGGEGLASLAQAFQFAGVPNLLVTLWPVDSAATEELIRIFYTELAARHWTGAPEALAAAQTQMRGSDRWHDPWYWAGFRLTGRG